MTDALIKFGLANIALSAAIMLVIALRRIVRLRFGSGFAYALWLLPLLAATACLLATRVVMIEAPAAPAPEAFAPIVAVGGDVLTTTAPPEVAPAFPAIDFSLLATLTWLAGAIAMGVALARRQALFMAQVRAGAAGPAVVGVLAPRIVTPADFAKRFDEAERRVVLAHEAVHLRRNDARINGVVVLLRCLCWFNPLVHVAAHLLRIDQELACDAAVIAKHPEARRAYAAALLKAQLATGHLPLGCHWPARSEHPLLERISMLKQTAPGRIHRIAGSVLLVALLIAVGVSVSTVMPAGTRYEARAQTATSIVTGEPRTDFDTGKTFYLRGRIERAEVRDNKLYAWVRATSTSQKLDDAGAPSAALWRLHPAPYFGPADALGIRGVGSELTLWGYDTVKLNCAPECRFYAATIIKPGTGQSEGFDVAPAGPAPRGQDAPAGAAAPSRATPDAPRPAASPQPIKIEPQQQAAPATRPEFESLPFILKDRADDSSRLSLSGVITSVQWINPAVRIHVRETDTGKAWVIETGTVNSLLRLIGQEKVHEGVVIAMQGFGARDPACSPACMIYAAPHWIMFDGVALNPPPQSGLTPVGLPRLTPLDIPVGGPVAGGYPFASVFDSSAPIVVVGRIAAVDYSGPYTVISLQAETLAAGDPSRGPVPDAANTQVWRAETYPANKLTVEMRAKLAVGARLRIRGFNAKDATCQTACRMNARDVFFLD